MGGTPASASENIPPRQGQGFSDSIGFKGFVVFGWMKYNGEEFDQRGGVISIGRRITVREAAGHPGYRSVSSISSI